jgi:hypothetical protein
MAQLNGPLDITGKIGKLSIYKDKNGKTIVRHNPGPSRKEIRTKPAYEGMRNSGSEQGLASSSGAALRRSLREIKEYCSSSNMYYRMTACFRRIMKTDRTNPVGQKTISAGELSPLEDFEWNDKLALEHALQADFSGAIDPATGEMNLIISSFTPSVQITAPEGATHFELIAVAAAWHPEEKKVTHEFQRTDLKSLTSKNIKAQTFQFSPILVDHPILFVGLGIRFFSQTGTKSSPLKGGAFRILKAASTAKKTSA